MKQRTRLMHNGDELASFNMVNSKKDDGDDHDVQLHKMKSPEHFIEAQVQPGDTLQAIALRFYCSISELKRINHMHKDNEIFARRTIKVPITPFSVLTERIPTLQGTEAVPSTSNQTLTLIQELAHSVNQQNVLSINNTNTKEDNDCSIDCNAVVLNSTLAPAVLQYTDFTETDQVEQVTEDTQLLPNKEKISVEAVVVKELTSHGADFGLKWFHLVGFMLVLGVVVPLVYIMFYLDKHEAEHTDLPPLS